MSPQELATRWGVSRQLARVWLSRLPELDALDPAPYIKLAERYGATSLDVATWPIERLDLLAAGAAVSHRRPAIADLIGECHKRGFTLSELAEATFWTANAMRAWRSGSRVNRLWDAILGMEVRHTC